MLVILPVEKDRADRVREVDEREEGAERVKLTGVVKLIVEPEMLLIPAMANGLADSVKLIVELEILVNGVNETLGAVVVKVTEEELERD